MSPSLIHVRNLCRTLSGDDLGRLFAAYGPVVAATVRTYPATDQSTGTGTVRMDSDEAAAAAVAGLDGRACGGGHNMQVTRDGPPGWLPAGPPEPAAGRAAQAAVADGRHDRAGV